MSARSSPLLCAAKQAIPKKQLPIAPASRSLLAPRKNKGCILGCVLRRSTPCRHTPSDGQILRNLRSQPMTAADFRRIALRLEGVEEYSHAGLPAFRVGGRKFASLASQAGGYGNLMLTPEQQAAFVEEAPEIFLPIPGGFGRMGHTHIRLAAASEDVLAGALQAAWKLRIDKNAKTSRQNTMSRSSGVTDKNRGKRRL